MRAMQPDSAGDPASLPLPIATEHVLDDAVRVEVEQSGGMWWTLPDDACEQVRKRHLEGEREAGYEWEWAREGEESDVSAYAIDFSTMTQRDMRTGDISAVRFVRFPTGTSARIAAGSGTLRLQVEFRNEKWWDLPNSAELLGKYLDDWAEVSYVWHWEGARDGSYTNPEGETTPFS